MTFHRRISVIVVWPKSALILVRAAVRGIRRIDPEQRPEFVLLFRRQRRCPVNDLSDVFVHVHHFAPSIRNGLACPHFAHNLWNIAVIY